MTDSPITAHIGADWEIPFDVTSIDGSAADLTGRTFEMRLAWPLADSDTPAELVATGTGSAGVYTVTATAAETAGVTAGVYRCQLIETTTGAADVLFDGTLAAKHIIAPDDGLS